jgi:hypothetical protein
MLPYFVAEDDFRPKLEKVHADKNGCLYAASGYGILRIKRDRTYRQYDEIPGYPPAEGLIQSAIDRDGNKASLIKTDDLLRLLSAASWTRLQNTDECKKCKGIGVLECEHCGSDYDCRECNSTGRVPAAHCSEMALIATEETYIIKIGEAKYVANRLYPIALMARMLDVDEIRYLHRSEKDAGVFSFDGADIYVMPYLSDSPDAEIMLEQIPSPKSQKSQGHQQEKLN